jgi:hypothetical protein
MGKDDDPVQNPFEDIKLGGSQVKKLFKGCDVAIPELSDRDKQFIFVGKYECRAHEGDKKGDIIHIKPSYRNIEEFISYLESDKDDNGTAKYLDIVQYLRDEKNYGIAANDRFPQTTTMVMEYDQRLIRAYYLLGEYVARKHLNEQIAKWLTSE